MKIFSKYFRKYPKQKSSPTPLNNNRIGQNEPCLVFVKHVVESLVELAGHGVDLQLLSDDLVLELVYSEVELADVHLGVL